ncbi:hypothetical protein BG452_06220 [Streptomyces sp. CBMA123]|nr:hypothetical protein [Streptomyces sp. CBMA123]
MMALEDKHPHVFATSQFPALDQSVREARQFVKTAYQCFEVETDAAELVVSELVTNGVQHTKRPVRVTLFTPAWGLLRIEVADTSTVLPEPREAGPEDEGGRGIGLAKELSESFEVSPVPGGKVVCVSIAIGDVKPSPEEALDTATRLLGLMDPQHLKRLMLRLGEQIGAEITVDGHPITQGMAALKIMRDVEKPGWGLPASPAILPSGEQRIMEGVR